MSLLSIGDLEGFMKYGFPGLVAIFGILLFLIFRTQYQKHLSNKEFLIKTIPFIVITIGLLVFAFVSLYSDRKLNEITEVNMYEKRIDSLQRELSIYKGSSLGNENLKAKYDEIIAQRDSLNTKVDFFKQDMKFNEDFINNNVVLEIADNFEISLNQTSGKEDSHEDKVDGQGKTSSIKQLKLSEQEIHYRRIKAGAFLNIFSYGGDTGVLRKVLLVIQRRGTYVDINKLIKECPSFISIKRNWLIAVKNALDIESAKYGDKSVKQDEPHISFPVPKEFWILREPYVVYFSASSYHSITRELKLLNKLLL